MLRLYEHGEILVVDEDQYHLKSLRVLFQELGCETVGLASLMSLPLELRRRQISVVILGDYLNREFSEMFKLILQAEYRGPVIVVSRRNCLDDKVQAYRLGCDDYLTKPVEYLELLARVKSVSRWFYLSDMNKTGGNVLQVGDVTLNLSSQVFSSDLVAEACLTPTQTKLLSVLMRNAGIVLSRSTLVDRVWGYELIGDTNRVDVNVRKLRWKIEPDPGNPRYIHTVRGVGYRFVVC